VELGQEDGGAALGQSDDGVELGAKQGSQGKEQGKEYEEALECDRRRDGLLHGVDYSGVAYRCFFFALVTKFLLIL
jgi:hypothetical protein